MKKKLLLVFLVASIIVLLRFVSDTSDSQFGSPPVASPPNVKDSGSDNKANGEGGKLFNPIIEEKSEEDENSPDHHHNKGENKENEEEENVDKEAEDNNEKADNNAEGENDHEGEGEVDEDPLNVEIKNEDETENKPTKEKVDPEKVEADNDLKEEKAQVIYDEKNKDKEILHKNDEKPPVFQFHPANEGANNPEEDNDADNGVAAAVEMEKEVEDNEKEEEEEDNNVVIADENEVLDDQKLTSTIQYTFVDTNSETSGEIRETQSTESLPSTANDEEDDEEGEPQRTRIKINENVGDDGLNENEAQANDAEVANKRSVVDDDGEFSGDKSRLIAHKEFVDGQVKWMVTYIVHGRYVPKGFKQDAMCIFNNTHKVSMEFRSDPLWYTHTFTCPLPESLRLVRPLNVVLASADYKKVVNLTLRSQPPPEKPLFNLGAYIRIASTEFSYMNEWVEWQLMMGVEHVWVYDNSANQQAKFYLMPYIRSGLVTVVPWQPKDSWAQQVVAEMHMIYRYGKHYTKWLLLCDADEFMYPMKANNYLSVLDEQERMAIARGEDFVALRVKSMIFNANPRVKEELSLVTSRFLWHNESVVAEGREKNFILPANVTFFSIHNVHTPNKTIDLDWRDTMRMNHYWGRDIDRRPEFPNYTAIYDPEILTRFTPILKTRLKKRFGSLPILPTEFTGERETIHY